jgi:hypothetical protein
MPRRIPWLLSLVASLVAVVWARGADQNEAKKAKVASTPEEAVQRAADAFKAGDAEALIGQLGEPAHTEAQAQLKIMAAQEAREDALTKKFGKDPNNKRPRMSVKDSLKQTKSLTVLSKKELAKDRVELKVWVSRIEPFDKKERIVEQTWTAVKSGAGWKLLVPMGPRGPTRDVVIRKGPDGKEVKVYIEKHLKADPQLVAYIQKTLATFLALVKKHTVDVEAGKYKTREEALAALRKAQEAFTKENPPPRRRAEEKPRQ